MKLFSLRPARSRPKTTGEVYLGTTPDGFVRTEEVISADTRVIRVYYPGGSLFSETWRVGDDLHRLDGPAKTTYTGDGVLLEEEWSDRGRRSRSGGPAWSSFRSDGTAEYEEWNRQSLAERLDGPARTHFGTNGEVLRNDWFVLGAYAEDHVVAATILSRNPVPDVLAAIRWSTFAPLLDQGGSAAEVIEAIGAGVFTVEGVLAIRAGAPVEWVAAWENGST